MTSWLVHLCFYFCSWGNTQTINWFYWFLLEFLDYFCWILSIQSHFWASWNYFAFLFKLFLIKRLERRNSLFVFNGAHLTLINRLFLSNFETIDLLIKGLSMNLRRFRMMKKIVFSLSFGWNIFIPRSIRIALIFVMGVSDSCRSTHR